VSEFLLLMHGDTTQQPTGDMWTSYLQSLRQRGCFQGGSSIGDGDCVRREGAPAPINRQVVGYIRISAADLAEAKLLVADNPVFECGGTVEIRELPRE
jgi:hypothetical protein